MEKEKDYGNTTNVTSRSFLLFLLASQVDSSKGAESGFVFSFYFVDPNVSYSFIFLLKPNYSFRLIKMYLKKLFEHMIHIFKFPVRVESKFEFN